MAPHRIWLALIVLLLTLACGEADLPQSEEGDIVFALRGQLGGETLDLRAGQDGYFMTTGFERGPDGVYWYSGTLEPVTGSGGSLRIALRHTRRLRAGELPRMDSALAAGSYAYYADTPPAGGFVYEVQFTPEGDTSAANQYAWDLGDGTTSQVAAPRHRYTDPDLLTPEVCLETLDPSGCTTSICQPVALADSSCRVDFSHYLYPGLTFVTFAAEVQGGQPPFRYNWDFGDGFGATLGNPGYFFSNPAHYEVCLTVTDAVGCVATTCKTIAADPVLCEHNFTYEVLRTRAPDTLQLSTVEVTWTRPDGQVFRSAAGTQGPDSYFELLEALPYVPSPEGIATQRLRLRLQCTLYGAQEEVTLRGAEGTLGVGHP